MKDPKRLREWGADDFERMLLTSATDDQASPETLQRVLHSVQVAQLEPTQGTEHAGRLQLLASHGAVVAKSVVLVATLTLLAVLGMQRRTRPPREALPPPAPALAPSAAPADKPPSPPPQPVTATTELTVQALAAPKPSASLRSKHKPSVHPPPIPVPQTTKQSTAAAPAPAAPPPAPSEAEVLADALRSLHAHDPQTSLGRLDAYDRSFPQGTLRVEAAVLRARALLLSGHRERAAVFAAEFLATHSVNPKSVSGRALSAFCNKP